MFTYHCRRMLNCFFSPIFIVLLCIYAFWIIDILFQFRALGGALPEFIIAVQLNRHYFLFVGLPLYIILMTQCCNTRQAILLVRNQKFFSTFMSNMVAASCGATLFVVAHLVVAISVGILGNLTISNVFSSKIFNNIYYAGSFSVLQKSFETPLPAVVYSALYLVLGLCLVSSIILFVFQFMKDSKATIVLLIVYLLAFASIQKGIGSNFPYVYLNYYMFLADALSSPYTIFIFFCLLFAWFSMILFVKQFWWCANK